MVHGLDILARPSLAFDLRRMEDDKRLDLSLGLVFGGSSSKSNKKGNVSLNSSSNDTNRTIKVLSDFRNFLSGGIPQQPQGGYSTNLPVSAMNDYSSWDQNEEGEKGLLVSDKRKYISEKMDGIKKQETEAQNSDLLDNAGTSHISITTDDDVSTADNEDVAESGAETSRLVPNMEEANLQASSVASKELPGKVASSLRPFSLHSASSLSARNGSMMFGYSDCQLPSIDNGSPWGMVKHPPLLHPYSGRPMSAPATNHGLSEGENPAMKEASSSRVLEDNRSKTSNGSIVFKENNSFPSEYPSIRPRMAAGLKFGGAGSSPNLPWVSTTGPGLNGRTVSGVTYRFSANQIKIVCACHGLHMSPHDFIQHASDEPLTIADVQAQSTANAAASAKS
ncbi:hypothetical protein V2J09_000313 [Rumex salicifolius]